MRRAALALLLLSLGACGEKSPQPPENAAAALEAVARERGVVRDRSTAITGSYARGADRFCAVPDRGRYRVGVSVAYDAANGCVATGTAEQVRERVRIDLGQECTFAARFDGERLTLPGRVPDPCRNLCRGAASLAGLSVDRISEVAAEAAATRDESGRSLCRS